jgi:hypothetical protein
MSFQGSSHGLAVSVELDVPGLGSTDEMNNLDLVAVAENSQGKAMKLMAAGANLMKKPWIKNLQVGGNQPT